jgi:hypothetical protein
MVECLYVLSAALEVFGILFVIRDVRDDLANARTLVAAQTAAKGAMSPVVPYVAIVDAIIGSLSAKRWRRVWGPALVVAGVFVGLAANLATL